MNKKTGLVISSITLALGILAVPVFAGTDTKTETQASVPTVNVTSQNIRTVADTSETPLTPATPESTDNQAAPATPATPASPAYPNNQTGCGSISAEAMQSIHNSSVMQDAMNSGDFDKMRDAMNSPEIRAQLGDDVVNSMNGMMSGINNQSMYGSQGMMGSGARNMMNWQ